MDFILAYVVLISINFKMELCFARKNILFLVADDMRPQLGVYYGKDFPSPIHPTMHTPNLDALATRSLLLKRAYVQQAVCSPSRTSLLTGRRPDTTHVYDLKHYFRKVGGNFTTIPQFFKENGYRTIGMGKIFHPGPASGYDDPISWTDPYFHGIPNFEKKSHSWTAVPDYKLKKKSLRDMQITDHAIKTLREVAPDAKSGKRNFFVAVGFHKPHLPFVFPESFMKKFYPADKIKLPDNPFAPVNMPAIAWSSYPELRGYRDISALNASGRINTTLPDATVLKLRRAYYSALTYVDSLYGSIIAELDKLGLSNNTIISFWADHGWQLGEHGEWCKHTNFELATHAPMMLHIPGETDAGIQTEALTEFVDLFPTLVEAAGFAALPLCPKYSNNTKLCTEGTSMLSLVLNPDKPIKNASFSQYPRPGSIMGYTIRTDRLRYTEWADFSYTEYKPNWNNLVGVELYDHDDDPEENVNKADFTSYKSIRKELSDRLHKGWRYA